MEQMHVHSFMYKVQRAIMLLVLESYIL